MKGINKALNDAIKDEVIAKEARDSAKELVKLRRPVTRREIEDLEEMARLEKDFILG